jgi:UDP-N-acetylmuramate dehydrogenase
VLERADIPLSPLTTLRLGGPAATLAEPTTVDELVSAVRDADAAGTGVLLIGGGSNLVLADAGWPGTAVLLRHRGVDVTVDGDRIELDVAAGEPWDALVARTVDEGWAGWECLSGIPGLVGATPVQNVGAYGQEIAETISSVRVWDRTDATIRELAPVECRFGYRDSRFKHSERYVVLSVRFSLRRQPHSAPVRYAELARRLGVDEGCPAPLASVRAAVLELRRGKGMVLDPGDHDTWSAGSFFTNPVVTAAAADAVQAGLAPGTSYPHWPGPDGTVKLSAAWLIERSGFGKGRQVGRVAVSGKHTLALTNRGGGTTAELVTLAREIRDGVRDRFGVTLRPEPRLVGVTLD